MRSFILLIFLAQPAYAQDGIRASDTVLTAQQLSDTLGGQVAEFFDGSKSKSAWLSTTARNAATPLF